MPNGRNGNIWRETWAAISEGSPSKGTRMEALAFSAARSVALGSLIMQNTWRNVEYSAFFLSWNAPPAWQLPALREEQMMKNETLGSNVMSFSSSLSPDKEAPKKKKRKNAAMAARESAP